MIDGGDFDDIISMIESCTRDDSSVGNCSHTLMIDDTIEVRISVWSNRNLFGMNEKVRGCLRLGRYFSESKSFDLFWSIAILTSQTSLSIHVLREERSTAAGTTSSSQWCKVKAPRIQNTRVMHDSKVFKLELWARPSRLTQNLGTLRMPPSRLNCRQSDQECGCRLSGPCWGQNR